MPRSMVRRWGVKGTISVPISLNPYNERASTGRKMACAKRRADANSNDRSLRVLKLVSMSSTMESGNADSLANTATFCGFPSSSNAKLSLVKVAIGAPSASVTVTNTFTSFTSTLNVLSVCGSSTLPLGLLEEAEACAGGCAVPEGDEAHGGFGTWAGQIATASAKKTIRRGMKIWIALSVLFSKALLSKLCG